MADLTKYARTPITDGLKRLLNAPARHKFNEYDKYTKADILAIRLYNTAVAGNVQASKEILDRVEGKVAQVIAGDPNNPIKIDLATALDRAIRLYDSQTIDGQAERLVDYQAIAPETVGPAITEERNCEAISFADYCTTTSKDSLSISSKTATLGTPQESQVHHPICGIDDLL